MLRRDWIVVLAVVVWWTLEGFVTTGQLLTMQFKDAAVLGMGEALRRGLLSAWLWVPCSLALLWCARRFPIERGRMLRSVAVLTLAALAVVLFRAVAISVFNPWLGWYEVLPHVAALTTRL